MGGETYSRFFSRYGFVDRSSLSKSQFKVRELSRSYLAGSGGGVLECGSVGGGRGFEGGVGARMGLHARV